DRRRVDRRGIGGRSRGIGRCGLGRRRVELGGLVPLSCHGIELGRLGIGLAVLSLLTGTTAPPRQRQQTRPLRSGLLLGAAFAGRVHVSCCFLHQKHVSDPSVSFRDMSLRVKTEAVVLHESCSRSLIEIVSESWAKSPLEPLDLVLTSEASTPMRMFSNSASPLSPVMPIFRSFAEAGSPSPPALMRTPTLPTGVSVTADWQRFSSVASLMLAVTTECLPPSASLAIPLYWENPVPSSCDEVIWNCVPETANETGTAPWATPPMSMADTTPVGTATSAMRPAWDEQSLRMRLGFRNFIDPPRTPAPVPTSLV